MGISEGNQRYAARTVENRRQTLPQLCFSVIGTKRSRITVTMDVNKARRNAEAACVNRIFCLPQVFPDCGDFISLYRQIGKNGRSAAAVNQHTAGN